MVKLVSFTKIFLLIVANEVSKKQLFRFIE